jgi:hypothetical protein
MYRDAYNTKGSTEKSFFMKKIVKERIFMMMMLLLLWVERKDVGF